MLQFLITIGAKKVRRKWCTKTLRVLNAAQDLISHHVLQFLITIGAKKVRRKWCTKTLRVLNAAQDLISKKSRSFSVVQKRF